MTRKMRRCMPCGLEYREPPDWDDPDPTKAEADKCNATINRLEIALEDANRDWLKRVRETDIEAALECYLASERERFKVLSEASRRTERAL